MLHKAIKGYEDYLVTDDGRVYSLKSQKYLRCGLCTNGYLGARLYKNGISRTITVHRLVAECFIPNPNNLPQVDHINRLKTDNRVENLRWVSASTNSKNRDHYSINRKSKGMSIVEKISSEVSIGYLSLASVPDTDRSLLSRNIKKGKTHFFCKGREFFTEPKA